LDVTFSSQITQLIFPTAGHVFHTFIFAITEMEKSDFMKQFALPQGSQHFRCSSVRFNYQLCYVTFSTFPFWYTGK